MSMSSVNSEKCGKSAMFVRGAEIISPQIALLEMWNRPFVSAIVPEQHTQMLWNAASDDPHTDMHAAASSRNSANSLGGSDDDGGSQVYTKYDTFGSGRYVRKCEAHSGLPPVFALICVSFSSLSLLCAQSLDHFLCMPSL